MGLIISSLSKRYLRSDPAQQALTNVSFSVPKGAFVTLLGPSGCGKSTLLNLIAGLDRPTSGSIQIGGGTVYDEAKKLFVPPAARNISMVFQSYAIWPHMTVRQNVEFPLKHGRKRSESLANRDAAVTRALGKVHLTEFQDRPAPLLSGGQQQRVSLARALAQNPAVILLDEPLSNLDANLREAMQKEIRSIVSDEGITAVYVTHDQKEALSMSDIIVVMKEGQIEQIGSPDDIYYRPATRFVARFMGAPNLVHANVVAVDVGCNQIIVECALGTIRVRKQNDDAIRVGEPLTLVLKQEDMHTGPIPVDVPSTNCYELPVVRRIFLGDRMEVICSMGKESDQRLSIYTSARGVTDGKYLAIHCKAEEIHYFRGQ
jgi:iron(III) transport system ATP-binding protein